MMAIRGGGWHGRDVPQRAPQYRAARDALLRRQLELRREMESVAAELRSLPPGGEVPKDYVFERMGADGEPATVRLSELFGGSDTLMLYNYMFPRHAQDRRPGPSSGPRRGFRWRRAPALPAPR